MLVVWQCISTLSLLLFLFPTCLLPFCFFPHFFSHFSSFSPYRCISLSPLTFPISLPSFPSSFTTFPFFSLYLPISFPHPSHNLPSLSSVPSLPFPRTRTSTRRHCLYISMPTRLKAFFKQLVLTSPLLTDENSKREKFRTRMRSFFDICLFLSRVTFLPQIIIMVMIILSGDEVFVGFYLES